MSDEFELLVAIIAMLTTKLELAETRISSLERAYEMRIHALEIGLARSSHKPVVPIPAVLIFHDSAA